MAKKKVAKRVAKRVDEKSGTEVHIAAPNLKTVSFTIIGESPYVQHKFGPKAKAHMRATQAAGTTAVRGRKRAPKDFQQCYKDSQYVPKKGKWPNGAIPATGIRAAMIAACRLVDFAMTNTKQVLYVEADDYDADERIPLIRITKGKPRYFEQVVRNSNGEPDIRARALWEPGWEAVVRITYDADQLTLIDVTNLLSRAGMQVGIGEGRLASKKCAGLQWGTFRLK